MILPVSENFYAKLQVLLEHRKYTLAEHELQQMLAVDPDDSIAHAFLGLCLMKTGRYQEAHTATRQAIALDPESDYNFRLLSLIYEKEKNFPEAEKAVRQSLFLNPDHVFNYALLARILFNQNRYDEALEVVDSGLEIDPEDVECLNVQARLFVRLGKPEQATLNFQNSLKQDPENFYTHANRGIALAETGDRKSAIDHFKEAIRLNPDYELAKRFLLGTYKAQFAFYRYAMKLTYRLRESKVPEKWLILFGICIIFKFSPAFLPFYLILLHFSLFNEVFFNFLVSFNPDARRFLLKEELLQIKVLGILILLTGGMYLIGKTSGVYLMVNSSLILISLSIPFVSSFYVKTQISLKNTYIFLYYLFLAGLLYLILSYFFPENNPHAGIAEAALVLFNLGLIGFCWFRKNL